MAKLVRNILICIIISCCAFVGINTISESILVHYRGQTTAQKIEMGFDNAVNGRYDCFVLGNSKMYRGINPDKITSARFFNFAHDNDAYNQMYYKLIYLEEHDVDIAKLIIDADYNHFSFISTTRNYVYDRYFGKDYMLDFEKTVFDEVISDVVRYNNVQGDNIWYSIYDIVHSKENSQISYMKDNGQYITYGTATDHDPVTVKGDILDIQLYYFDKIVDNCIANNIELYVIVPPARDIEREAYGYSEVDFETFDNMIKEHLTEKYADNYYNYSASDEFKDMSNYVDSAHLNVDAADRFSERINKDIFR